MITDFPEKDADRKIITVDKPKSQSSGNNIEKPPVGTPPIPHDTGNIIKSDSNISGLKSSSIEHSEKQPPHNFPLATEKDKLKLDTPDTLPSSSKGTILEKEISPKLPSTIPPIPSLAHDNILNKIKNIVGNDILEIFGDTGSGKSKFVHKIALEALSQGNTVFYLDTERNLNRIDIQALGNNYKYTPRFNEVMNIVRTLPKYDIVIIDSVGLPILTHYAQMSMKERGDALLQLIALMGYLKEWTFKNNAMAIVTNQPESDFNKTPGTIRNPFGDKSCFVVKEIWRMHNISQTIHLTKSELLSFRSREMGRDTKIFNIDINKETKIY